MEGKSSAQTLKAMRFETFTCQFFGQLSHFNLKFFYYHILAILSKNATELIRFFKYVRNSFFQKKKLSFFKTVKSWQICCGLRIK